MAVSSLKSSMCSFFWVFNVTVLVSGLARADETTINNNESVKPDIALLEFLGNTAGLESLGIDIDQILASAVQSHKDKMRDEDSEN